MNVLLNGRKYLLFAGTFLKKAPSACTLYDAKI